MQFSFDSWFKALSEGHHRITPQCRVRHDAQTMPLGNQDMPVFDADAVLRVVIPVDIGCG